MRGSALSPITHCVIRDDVFPVRGYCDWGNHSGGGETPVSVLPVIGYGAEIPLKKHLPAVRRRGPEAGVFAGADEYRGSGTNGIDLSLFLEPIFHL
jgi:hypothetical protein